MCTAPIRSMGGRLDVNDLNWETRKYENWNAYGQSKLCNVLFARHLAKRWVCHDGPCNGPGSVPHAGV